MTGRARQLSLIDMDELYSSPERAARERYAQRYIWGAVVLTALLVLVIAGAGYLLSRH